MANRWLSLLFETCEAGVSSAVAPELLPPNQNSWMLNGQNRGGKPSTRPDMTVRLNLPFGLVQGAEFFGVQGGMIILSIAGRLYRVRILGDQFSVDEIPLTFVNSPIIKQVWMTQTVETLVIQDGQSNAILYNGSTATRSFYGKVPRGRQMAYGNGRLWVAVNANEMLAGDIRTNAAGSELNFTEATFFTGGGKLYVQSPLTGLQFIPVTGQSDYGALLSFCLDETLAIRADITTRDDWAKVPGFVTTILRSVGAASQWSIASVNQDLYWRDSNRGIRSIRNALADEAGPGSSPVSREVSRLTDYDSQRQLAFCSSIYHDNRLLMTSSPFLMPNGGVGFKNLIALDFAPLSTLGGKSQAAYDGQWNGLNFIKLVGGKFRGRNRGFVISTDDDGNNQLWELGTGARADGARECEGETVTVEHPITCAVEYPLRDFGQSKARKLLQRCDVWLTSVNGPLDLKVYWRADNSMKWLKWDEAETCAKTTDAATAAPHVWKNLQPQERPQFKTFTMPEAVNEITKYATQVGFEFQIRLVWTGRARIHRMMCYGIQLDDSDYADRSGFEITCVENNITGNAVEYNIPTGGCPLIEVTDGSGMVENGGEFTYPSTFFSFPVDQEFFIYNTGDASLEIGEAVLENEEPGMFQLITQPDSIVPVGGFTTFIIRLTATVAGANSGTISFPTNVPGANPYHFDLLGTVLGEPTGYDYRSKTSDYVLCGFDEYTTPSTPPKKYRRQSIGGWALACQRYTDCNGLTAANSWNQYSGSYDYNALTCDETNNQVDDFGGETADGPCSLRGPTLSTSTPIKIFLPGYYYLCVEGVTMFTTKTAVNWTLDSPPYCDAGNITRGNNAAKILSQEDTVTDAIARENAGIGYDPVAETVAYVVQRVSGFTQGYASVWERYQFNYLESGQSYYLHLVYGRRINGTSDPFVEYATEDTAPFTATGGTEYSPYFELPNESGFDTKVISALVVPVV